MHGNYRNRRNHQNDSAVPVPETTPVENVVEKMPAAGIEGYCMKQYVNLKV